MKKIFLAFLLATIISLSPKVAHAQNLVLHNNTIQIAAADQGGVDGEGGDVDIFKGPTNEDFDNLNPLKIAESPVADQLSTPGGIVSRLLAFLFPLSGLVLFLLIVWGGFEILLNASDQKGMEAGKNRITAAIVGFILLFATYWMAQIVEVIFGITIL